MFIFEKLIWKIKDWFNPPTRQELIYRKLNKSREFGIPTPSPKYLQKRKYLTLDGIKNWDELTENDKYSLNIIN